VRQCSPKSWCCRGEHSVRLKTGIGISCVYSTWFSWLHILNSEGGWTGVALGPPLYGSGGMDWRSLGSPHHWMYHGFWKGKQVRGIPELQTNLVPYPRTYFNWNFFYGTSSYSALAKKTAGFIDLNTTYCGVDVRKTTAARSLRTIRLMEPHLRMFHSLTTIVAQGCRIAFLPTSSPALLCKQTVSCGPAQ
jgi:hypothetical protein